MLLRALIEAMDEVASSTAKPSAADREAFTNRLKQPANQTHTSGPPEVVQVPSGGNGGQ